MPPAMDVPAVKIFFKQTKTKSHKQPAIEENETQSGVSKVFSGRDGPKDENAPTPNCKFR